LASANRARLGRIGHYHPRDVGLEQSRDRVRVAGGLQRDLVGRRQTVREDPQRLRRRLDLSDLADHARLPDRDLRELTMHVEPDTPARHCLTSSIELVGEQAGKRHLRIRAHGATGRVAGAAKY
jgi:hypothetical protein